MPRAHATGLLNIEGVKNKISSDELYRAFAKHLQADAPFKFSEGPIEMLNSIGRLIYDLVFASQHEKAHGIMKSAVNKYSASDGEQRRSGPQMEMRF